MLIVISMGCKVTSESSIGVGKLSHIYTTGKTDLYRFGLVRKK
jgi:hypothetical protein